jgi:hypothetical protein
MELSHIALRIRVFKYTVGTDLQLQSAYQRFAENKTLPICAREIEHSRPYFIGLLGGQYGWTPCGCQYPEHLVAQQPWLAAHTGGTSVAELEALHGVLNNPEMGE